MIDLLDSQIRNKKDTPHIYSPLSKYPTELSHFTTGLCLIGSWKFNFQKFLLHQTICRKISGGAIFHLSSFSPLTPSSGQNRRFTLLGQWTGKYERNC